jgi:hypothetical protein
MRRTMGMGRRGPGLMGTVARTAVIAGTATVVSKGVSGSMNTRAAQQQQAQQQQPQAAYDAGVQQAQMQAQQEALAQQQQQMLAAQAANAQAATSGAGANDTVTQLQKLAELQQQGFLTPEEFAQQKAKLLGS